MDEKFMQLAINKARDGGQKGQTPFGACIVKNNELICCVHNVVWAITDITAHAEVHAIREACKKLNTIDLSGYCQPKQIAAVPIRPSVDKGFVLIRRQLLH